jgi:hypothetical protein
MSGKLKGTRVCVFCGGHDLNKEHVIPDWMSKYFADLTGYVASGWIGAQDGDVTTYDPPGPLPGPVIGNQRREVGSAGTFNQTVRLVCELCNRGWMSDLEAAVEPVLAPMFGGQPQLLSGYRADLVATWATKTSLVMTLSWAADLPREPFEQLYRDRRPSDSTTVWCAYRSEFLLRQDYKPLQSKWATPSGYPDHFNSSLIFGHVVLGVASRFLGCPPASPLLDATSQVTVWPPACRSSATWPPPRPVSDERLGLWINPPLTPIANPR